MQFNLRERTVVIAGSFSTTVQNIMMSLTQIGADVAYLDKNAGDAQRFCQNLTDRREIDEKHGRAIAVIADLSNFAAAKEAVGKVAHTFGAVDIYIDAHMSNEPTPLDLDLNLDSVEFDLDAIINHNLKIPMIMTQNMISYLKGRKRGRIIYLMNGGAALGTNPQDVYATAARTGLINFTKSFARQISDLSVTVNVLSLGMTEEYILGHYPGSTIKEALEKMKAHDMSLKIAEPDKIAHSVIYLVSQYGSAVNGQVLHLT